MADYYDVEKKRDGSYTVTPRDYDGCGTVIGGILLFLIIGLFLIFGSNSDSPPHSGQSKTDDQFVNGKTTENDDWLWLSDLSPINYDSLYSMSHYDTISNVGTKLSHCLRTGTSSHGAAGEGWIEYYLNGDYQYLTGCMAITQEFSNTTYIGSVVIFADGKEIYRYDSMQAGDVPVFFSIEIKNCERLRIEHKGGEPFRLAELKLWKTTPKE